MSSAVLKTTAKILAHHPMGRNKTVGTNKSEAGAEGRVEMKGRIEITVDWVWNKKNSKERERQK
jgi:hypothetical protein